MKLRNYISVLILSFCLILNILTAQADVLYNGPTSILETQPFSISCNCSLFANIKWRKSEPILYFESEDYTVLPEDRKYSNLAVISALPFHTGNYKCSYESDDYGHNLTVIVHNVAIELSIIHAGGSCGNTPQAIPSPSSSAAGSARSDTNTLKCAVAEPYSTNFTLRCKPEPASSISNLTLTWFKGDSIVRQNERTKVYGSDDLVLNFNPITPDDAGLYQCKAIKKGENANLVSPEKISAIDIKILPYVKNPRKDVTAVEENQFNLTCVVLSKDNTTVIWHVNTSEGHKTYNHSEGRIILNNVNASANALLLIKSANLTLDRGDYMCIARSDVGYSITNTTFNVRIKGKYAALWPFIGICAELIILVTIILIYEKKRDKTELEESDTDQGPETKSTPDHGQDGVRYRK